MAIIQNEFIFSSSPQWRGIYEATEVGRNGSSVTFNINIKLRLNGTSSSTFYGYAVNWRATLNGVSSGLLKVKGTERWYGGEGYRTFSTTLTTSVGASGGTVPLRIEILPNGGGNASSNNTYNVGYSTWNTPPHMSGNLNLSVSGTIPENTGNINLSWSGASDANNNVDGYQIYRFVNGSHNATFNATGTGYTDNISGFGQGTQIFYRVWARDTYGEWSNYLQSGTITKNVFTGANLSVNNNCLYDTNVINISYSGASNTNGNTSFSYAIFSDDIKIYNFDKVTGTPFNITIVRNGQTPPSTPYILFNDIKAFASGSGWQKTATFKFRTTNAYGSEAWSSRTISIDLRTSPNAPTTVTISGKTALADGRSYYIPDRGDITVTWSGASDKLGGSLTYEIQGRLGTGSFTPLKSGITGTSATVTVPKVSKEEDYTFRVIAKTNFNYTSYKDSGLEKMHFYNNPSIDFVNLNRTAEGVSVDVVTKANTSIPSVGFTTRSYTGLVTGTLTTSPQTLSKSGLDSGKSYSITVNLKDNTGLSNAITSTLTIPVYTPIMAVREKGVGVNTIPDGSAKFMVKGGAKITDGLTVDGVSIKCTRNFGKRMITVGGDKNTYYPVLLRANYGFATNKISISRGYNWQAPNDWNTSTHRGGLTLTFRWGGNSRVYTVEEFSETYTTMVGGMINTTGGFIVWLRGGNAVYQVDNDYGILLSVDVYLDPYTAPDKTVYSARTNVNNVKSEIMSCYCVRGTTLYSDNQKVLTNADLSGYKAQRNKVAFINPDGVMEVGKYIDFHNSDNGNDYDGRLTLADNGNLIYNHAIEASYLTVTDGGALQINGNGKFLKIGTGGSDCYFTNSKTNTYLQLKDNGDLGYSGKVMLDGYAPSLYNSMLTLYTARDGNGNGDGNTHLGYNSGNGYSHYFRGSGGVYVDCHKGLNAWDTYTRFLRSPSGQNVDIVADSGVMYFDVKSATGCGLIMDRRWSGSSGSEICLLNNKGSGWGFIGNSGQAFYRVYGTGGSVSDRNRKYDIHKFDPIYLYDQIKELNVYGYRTISDHVDDDGNVIDELHRSDMQLGCMVDELPTEAVIYDEEGGNGKAVDIYAYSTMILGCTKVLQDKVEVLEASNEDKDSRISELETQVEDLENRLKKLEEMVLNGIN